MTSSAGPPSAKVRHAPLWQLCLVFVLSLLLFLVIRWQPELWLQQQINQQARYNGIDLQYEALHIEGLSVRLDKVSVRTAELPVPVKLDSLGISPAWASLLAGEVAVDVRATLLGQSAEVALIWQDPYINVQILHADFDVAALQPLWKKRMIFPVDVGGRLKLSGKVQIDAIRGRPLGGKIDAQWQAVTIDLPTLDKPLGDYQLILKTLDNSSGQWQWVLSGGPAVVLSGSGQIDMSASLPQQWTVHGQLELQAAPDATAVASLLGNQKRLFSISGSLMNTQVLPLAH